MAKQMPPVPPAQRSPKGPGADPDSARKVAGGNREVPENVEKQAQQGNIKQNTTNQGYQQDR